MCLQSYDSSTSRSFKYFSKSSKAVTAVCTCDAPPREYMVVVDKSQSSLKETVQALSDCLGNGQVSTPTADGLDDLLMSDAGLRALQSNVKFDSEQLSYTGLVGKDGVSNGDGLVVNVSLVCSEFVSALNVRPLQIGLAGPPAVGKTTHAAALAAEYYLPVFNWADSYLMFC